MPRPAIPIPKGFEGIPLTDITDPRDADVLCGRGGAALRHPGNQTYRRLVNLNKGLYITCLKTEKLKISRSIVAAIREQKGRFLERVGNDGNWFDIGDKKAIEKTSQALREGQPKLRQKMVEMGGPSSAMTLDHQFPNGIYNPTGLVHPQAQAQAAAMMNMSQNNAMPPMPPPAARQISQQDVMSDMMMKQLSLNSIPDNRQMQMPAMANNNNSNSTNNSNVTSNMNMPRPQAQQSQAPQHQQQHPQMRQTPMPPPTQHHQPLGQPLQSAMKRPLMNSSSGISPTNSFQLQSGTPPTVPSNDTPMRNKLDRRRLFAKMKYSRPASGRFNHSNRSIGTDGMPDIHMVESTFSLMSNLSGQGGNHDHKMKDALSNFSDHGKDYLAYGSRRSLMSGLSKISDASDVNSIFSDLSRKIGNVSTRSIAMSEISGIEEGYQEDLEESFSMLEQASSTTTPTAAGGDLELS